MRIRPFIPNDLPAVMLIVREALGENYPTTIFLDIHKWWRDGFLVAEVNGNPVGFLAAVIPANGHARVLMLAVTAGFRARGIGSLLMQAFLQHCGVRGLKRIELEVRISNKAAIRFYERHGFNIFHTLPRFYTDGEDGYKMVRYLPHSGS